MPLLIYVTLEVKLLHPDLVREIFWLITNHVFMHNGNSSRHPCSLCRRYHFLVLHIELYREVWFGRGDRR